LIRSVDMNECPTCGRKLRGDACPYCDEEGLGEDDVEANPVSGESLVAVYGCHDERQADHVISLLESEGIPAFQISSEDLEATSDSADLDGDIIIQVGEEDEDRAREVIESAEPDIEIED
jgi:hypothetical protein